MTIFNMKKIYCINSYCNSFLINGFALSHMEFPTYFAQFCDQLCINAKSEGFVTCQLYSSTFSQYRLECVLNKKIKINASFFQHLEGK